MKWIWNELNALWHYIHLKYYQPKNSLKKPVHIICQASWNMQLYFNKIPFAVYFTFQTKGQNLTFSTANHHSHKKNVSVFPPRPPLISNLLTNLLPCNSAYATVTWEIFTVTVTVKIT